MVFSFVLDFWPISSEILRLFRAIHDNFLCVCIYRDSCEKVVLHRDPQSSLPPIPANANDNPRPLPSGKFGQQDDIAEPPPELADLKNAPWFQAGLPRWVNQSFMANRMLLGKPNSECSGLYFIPLSNKFVQKKTSRNKFELIVKRKCLIFSLKVNQVKFTAYSSLMSSFLSGIVRFSW